MYGADTRSLGFIISNAYYLIELAWLCNLIALSFYVLIPGNIVVIQISFDDPEIYQIIQTR